MQNQKAAQSQKIMIFILTMTVYGIACLISELIPKLQIGIFELSVKYFLFIPLSLAMLLDPLSVALGASTGKIIFGSMMLGKFKGLGSFKKFFTVAIGVYIAGRMVKDPKNKKMVGIAALTGTAVQLFLGVAIDILLFRLAHVGFDAIPGLPESIYAVKGFEALNDLLFTGILFCLLPTLYMVPRLHGKIEPLMGIKLRDEKTAGGNERVLTPKVVIWCMLGFLAAYVTNYLSESSILFFAFMVGPSLPVVLAGGVLLAIVVILLWRKRNKKDRT